MTAFDPSTDLPASVDTLEKLMAFAILAMKKPYGAKTYTEVEGQTPANVVTASIFDTDDGNNPTRLIGRYSLPVNPDWTTSNLKVYELINEVGTVDFPAEFKA